jgi:hypothetical protein
VVFCSTTFGAGVNASQRPITCPKRQLPRTLYAIGLTLIKKLKNDHFIVFGVVYF